MNDNRNELNAVLPQFPISFLMFYIKGAISDPDMGSEDKRVYQTVITMNVEVRPQFSITITSNETEYIFVVSKDQKYHRLSVVVENIVCRGQDNYLLLQSLV